MNERQHNRFLMDKIGTSLNDFPSSKVFVTAIRDAFLAHRDAYEKGGILHRDVSIGNILIIKNDDGSYGGLLIDWDLAQEGNDLQNEQRQFSRSGTWQFMSIQVLRTVGKLHIVQDDLESFLWVILYGTVRYMRTSAMTHNLGAAMRSVFDSFTTVDGKVVRGGQNKVDFLQSVLPFKNHLDGLNNTDLTSLISSLRLMFFRYANHLADLLLESSELCASNANLTPDAAMQQALAQTKVNHLKAKDHNAMGEMFKKALDADGWPVDDANTDNLTQDSPLLSFSQESENNKRQKACELTFQLKVPRSLFYSTL